MTTVESPLLTVYTCPDGTPFPVEWPDEETRKFGWRWDQMHNPLPFTPLSDELGQDLLEGFGRAMDRMGSPVRPARPVSANGFRFGRMAPFDDDPALRQAMLRRDIEARVPRLVELWRTEYLPECEALSRATLLWDDPRWNLKQAVEHFEEVRAVRRRLGELHHLAMQPTQALANNLIAFCAREFGGDGQILAGELTSGYPNRSLDSAQALWDLSRLALTMPAVAALLRAESPTAVLERLSSTPGGSDFQRALDEILDEYGHRNEAFTELIFPRWIEDPRFPLLMVRRYLDMDDANAPEVVHRATAQVRLARTEEYAARLGDPEKEREFRRLCTLAAQRTILIEDHNFAIDQKAVSAARVPCLALGRRLVEQGNIEAAEDVLFLRLAEIAQAADQPAFDLRATVAHRRAERAKWMRVLPPTDIGDGPPPGPAPTDSFLGTFKTEPDPPGMVMGIAGSPGVIRGTARLIADLDDADLLQPGEILLTYSTAPPWTPLFAIAGGIVTDAGGIVSHCAVVAREYGIPAVVGTRNGTATIRDGSTITVDGTNGTVTLES